MEISAARRAVNYIVFLFFYLQFLSLVYLGIYWSKLGVDPSGFFSIEDVLTQSVSFSLPMSLLFLFYTLSAHIKSFDYYFEFERDSVWPGLLIILAMCLVLYAVAAYVPLAWDFLWIGAVVFFAHYVKYPVAMLLKPLNGEGLFGSKVSAFNYLAVLATGFAFAISLPAYEARSDILRDDLPLLRTESDGKTGFLIGKMGDYFIIRLDGDGQLVAIPPHQVESISY